MAELKRIKEAQKEFSLNWYSFDERFNENRTLYFPSLFEIKHRIFNERKTATEGYIMIRGGSVGMSKEDTYKDSIPLFSSPLWPREQ